MPIRLLLLAALALRLVGPAHADPAVATGFRVPVVKLAKAPTIDGNVADWRAEGAQWLKLPTTSPSFMDGPGEQAPTSGNFNPSPEIMAGVFGDRIFFALRWQDDRADTVYRKWVLQNGKYRRDQKLDDMAALRFHTAGTFSECMLSGDVYKVDVWRWSAGRSQLAGIADDMQHAFSLTAIDDAAVYQTERGTLYIRKTMDAGDAGWNVTPAPPKDSTGVHEGISVNGRASGSRGDVRAFGEWRDGVWTLELERKLDTGDPDDIRFVPGRAVTGQLALFNPGYHMQKQVTPSLQFEISGRKAGQE